MRWALPPISERPETRNPQAVTPRTPYPFDPVRDSIETTSNRAGTYTENLSSNCIPSISPDPEDLALSPRSSNESLKSAQSEVSSGTASGGIPLCDEEYWLDDESAEESVSTESSEDESLADSLWDPKDSPVRYKHLVSGREYSIASTQTEADVRSVTSLDQLEAAAVEYLASGGASYPKADDVYRAHTRLRLATTTDTFPRRTSSANDYPPTPTSPETQFSAIVAERQSVEGTLYKVVWRDSWVRRSRLPDIDAVRRAHIAHYGTAWEVQTSNAGHEY
ncbi:hypothetical protein LTR91_020844 [Friedmanniomyces endolithicus]|uniref:Chromo domain-containing protein n=1 Tax=Friedmanniomyces endolithicus TaxID=329885 RepID=A0AAN6H966_9PEZI|nr:hypothetical protein LTR57_018905 [Friedmanniomyces endolithicus]KAK0959468.1 hypothetical protein LTR91_020844 [Friedmanniomyces endolithicus]